jgi:trigger factor
MRKVEVETVDSVRRRLAVEVPGAEIEAEFARMYADLRRTAKVPGFRPGRAPRSLLERLFGEKVRADVFAKLIQDSFVEVLREHDIEPVGQPQITTEEADSGGPLRYSALVEIKPDVVAAGYTGLEVERPLHRIEESDVNRFLHQLQESLAQLHPVTDRSCAQRGDLAAVDFEVRSDGQTLQSVQDRLVEVVDPSDSESIGAHLSGAEVGTTVKFTVDFPADHPDERVAGKPVAFEVRIKSLATKEVPPLDDEFAKDHGECDTLAELRLKARERLETAASRQTDQAVHARVLSELVRVHELEVPEAMVERRTEVLVDELLENMGPRRPPVSKEAEVREQLRKGLREQARDHVKAGLILEAIARQERIEVSEEDLDAQVESIVSQVQAEMQEHVRALYKDTGRRAGLRAQLVQERALDLVARQARLRDVEAKQESC